MSTFTGGGVVESALPAFSDDDVAAFERDGFTSVDRITTDDEIEFLRDLYDDLMERPGTLKVTYAGTKPDGSHGEINQIFGPEMQRPELLETTYIANGMKVAARLLGVDEGDVTYGGVMLIRKPANGGRDTPWHHDEAYWTFADRICHSLSIWMPVDDVTVESGCMQYLPGSHHGDDIRQHTRPDFFTPLTLVDPPDFSPAVACPVPAGGASIHHCRTLHYAGPNVSDVPRRAFTCIFHAPWRERVPPFPRPWLA